MSRAAIHGEQLRPAEPDAHTLSPAGEDAAVGGVAVGDAAADASDHDPLVALCRSVQSVFIARGLTLATAESCTGGLIGHLLTEVPGSSDYYRGGLISYADALKEAELGVPATTLEHHGAVSAQACVAMADGARQRYGSDVAIAVTGIAGPTGGTPAKPVGLTYVAVSDARGHDVRRHEWSTDRSASKRLSAGAALELLLERMAGE